MTRVWDFVTGLVIFPTPIVLIAWLLSRFTFATFTLEGITVGVLTAALIFTFLPRKETP